MASLKATFDVDSLTFGDERGHSLSELTVSNATVVFRLFYKFASFVLVSSVGSYREVSYDCVVSFDSLEFEIGSSSTDKESFVKSKH